MPIYQYPHAGRAVASHDSHAGGAAKTSTAVVFLHSADRAGARVCGHVRTQICAGFRRNLASGRRPWLVRSLLPDRAEELMNRITLITLSLGLATTACSSSSKPTSAEYDDTAQAIASTTSTSNGDSASGGDVASMADAVSLSLGVV